MNIFCTHLCPIQSALALDDKRVVKMVVETAQMLSAALHRHGYEKSDIYKPSYVKHPCTLWAGNTRTNFTWLCDHGLALCAIYSAIYGREHKSQSIIQKCHDLVAHIPDGDLREFADCTEFKTYTNLSIHERYRMFMNLKWNTRDKTPPKFTRRKTPTWKR